MIVISRSGKMTRDTLLEDASVQGRHGLRDDSLSATSRGRAIVANIAPAADETIRRGDILALLGSTNG